MSATHAKGHFTHAMYSSPTTKEKGKGKVVVMEVDHKIVVPSSNPKIKTESWPQEEPKLDAGLNPFLEEDQRALVDELEELIHPSECAEWVHMLL